jgi:hypothetical protein
VLLLPGPCPGNSRVARPCGVGARRSHRPLVSSQDDAVRGGSASPWVPTRRVLASRNSFVGCADVLDGMLASGRKCRRASRCASELRNRAASKQQAALGQSPRASHAACKSVRWSAVAAMRARGESAAAWPSRCCGFGRCPVAALQGRAVGPRCWAALRGPPAPPTRRYSRSLARFRDFSIGAALTRLAVAIAPDG